jgi:hypothetical protein
MNLIWLVFLGVSLAGVLIRAAQAYAALGDPRIFRIEIIPYLLGLVVFMCAPWVSMGILLTIRLVPDAGMFFGEVPRNAWAWGWLGIVLVDTMVAVAWISLGGGARFLSRYPFLLNASSLGVGWLRIGAVVFFLCFWGIVGSYIWMS